MILPVSSFSLKKVNNFNFKSNVVITTFEDLDSSVNKEIVPFVKDNQQLYYDVGKIGYVLQHVVQLKKKNETDLFQYKFDQNLMGFLKNDDELSKIISSAEKFDIYKRDYDRFVKMASMPLYSENIQLKNKIDDVTLLYKDNDILNQISLVSNVYKKSIENLQDSLDNITLENLYPEVFKQTKDYNDKYMKAIAFTCLNPCYDGLKIINEMNKIKNELKSKDINYLPILNRLEYLQSQYYKIIENKKSFYENKPDIEKFVFENKNIENSLLKDDNLNQVYDALKVECDKKVSELYKNFKSEIDTGLGFNQNIDFLQCENLLQRLVKANSEIAEIFDSIKKSYIAKQYDNIQN